MGTAVARTNHNWSSHASTLSISSSTTDTKIAPQAFPRTQGSFQVQNETPFSRAASWSGGYSTAGKQLSLAGLVIPDLASNLSTENVSHDRRLPTATSQPSLSPAGFQDGAQSQLTVKDSSASPRASSTSSHPSPKQSHTNTSDPGSSMTSLNGSLANPSHPDYLRQTQFDQDDILENWLDRASDLAHNLSVAREEGTRLRLQSQQVRKKIRYAHEDALAIDIKIQRLIESRLATNLDDELRNALEAGHKARAEIIKLETSFEELEDDHDYVQYELQKAEETFVRDYFKDGTSSGEGTEEQYEFQMAPDSEQGLNDANSPATVKVGIIPLGNGRETTRQEDLQVVADSAVGFDDMHSASAIKGKISLFDTDFAKLASDVNYMDHRIVPPNFSNGEVDVDRHTSRNSTLYADNSSLEVSADLTTDDPLSDDNLQDQRWLLRTSLRFPRDGFDNLTPIESSQKSLGSPHIRRSVSIDESRLSHPATFMRQENSPRYRVNGWLLNRLRSSPTDILLFDADKSDTDPHASGLPKHVFISPRKLEDEADRRAAKEVVESWQVDDDDSRTNDAQESEDGWTMIPESVRPQSAHIRRTGFRATLGASQLRIRRRQPRPPFPTKPGTLERWAQTHSSPDLRQMLAQWF